MRGRRWMEGEEEKEEKEERVEEEKQVTPGVPELLEENLRNIIASQVTLVMNETDNRQ